MEPETQAARDAFLTAHGYSADDLYDEYHGTTKSGHNPRCFLCFLANTSRAHINHRWDKVHPRWSDHYVAVYDSHTRTYSAFIGQPYHLMDDERQEIEAIAQKHGLTLSITSRPDSGAWHNDGCMLIVLSRGAK